MYYIFVLFLIQGGATRKNDGECHLDDNGYYTDSVLYDYPSIGQVYRLLDKHKVSVCSVLNGKSLPRLAFTKINRNTFFIC